MLQIRFTVETDATPDRIRTRSPHGRLEFLEANGEVVASKQPQALLCLSGKNSVELLTFYAGYDRLNRRRKLPLREDMQSLVFEAVHGTSHAIAAISKRCVVCWSRDSESLLFKHDLENATFSTLGILRSIRLRNDLANTEAAKIVLVLVLVSAEKLAFCWLKSSGLEEILKFDHTLQYDSTKYCLSFGGVQDAIVWAADEAVLIDCEALQVAGRMKLTDYAQAVGICETSVLYCCGKYINIIRR
mmetsp:Transcript_11592/g.35425  ORF Transcript_11592/g.35425 Transcript_11592/m.35425 type:complete len:245 (-) Transcript_11592:1109-1843(-)